MSSCSPSRTSAESMGLLLRRNVGGSTRPPPCVSYLSCQRLMLFDDNPRRSAISWISQPSSSNWRALLFMSALMERYTMVKEEKYNLEWASSHLLNLLNLFICFILKHRKWRPDKNFRKPCKNLVLILIELRKSMSQKKNNNNNYNYNLNRHHLFFVPLANETRALLV